MKIKGRSRITVKGLNQERALNNIVKKMNIYNFKRESHDVSHFEIEYKHRKIAKKVMSEQNLEIISLSHQGLLDFFKRILTSYGIIAGIILSILSYIVQ